MKAEEAIWIALRKGGTVGYKAIDVDNIPWTICYLHGEAHPMDFPCKHCLRHAPDLRKIRNITTKKGQNDQ